MEENTKPHSDPAFPGQWTHENGLIDSWTGMTLRDYFAGQVLIGLSIRREGASDEHDAKNAYALADAMLAARLR